MIKRFILAFIMVFPLYSYSQYTISGKVIDTDGNSIEFANVVLMKPADSAFIKGTISNDEGFFQLNDIQEGNYELKISFLGFEPWIKIFLLNENVELGMIQLAENLQELDGIVVKVEKPLIEQKVDRLVFNVGQSIAATGGNALDALKVTPRIKIQDNEISMIGKGNLMVMINDRLIQLSGKELANYLKSLNAENLLRIEVISNPPAKYSAEGNSGLINIITKKVATEAWNASLRGSYKQATYITGNAGGSFNFQKEKFKLTSNINYTNGSTAPVETNQVFYPDIIWKETNNRRDYYNVLSTRAGVEYNINNKLSTGLNYKYITSQPLVKDNNVVNIYNSLSNSIDSIIKTPAISEYEKDIHSFNYHLIYKMDTIGRKLSLDFDFFHFYNNTNRKYHTQTFYPDNQPIPNSYVKARNFGTQDIQNYSVNLDMEHPTDWLTLNYGGKVSFIDTKNLSDFYEYIDSEEILDQDLSNRFDYKENTQALYFSAQKSFSDKWEAKVGLRLENTQTKGYSKTLNQTHTNHYTKLFPTAYLAYTLNDDNSFNLNYGRRISRPRYQFLNPFVTVFSPYSYVEGNPFLQPSFIDNIELSYSYKDKLITNLYYSYTDDFSGQATFIDEETNIQRIFPENYLSSHVFGINQSFNITPVKRWEVYATADIYYYSGRAIIPNLLEQIDSWNGEFNISNNVVLNKRKTFFFNLSFYYATKGAYFLDETSEASRLDASIKYLLLDKKLTLSLYANDIFSSQRFIYTTYSNNIKNSFKNYYDQRYIRLSIVYNFGKKFETTNRQNKNQDELNRTD